MNDGDWEIIPVRHGDIGNMSGRLTCARGFDRNFRLLSNEQNGDEVCDKQQENPNHKYFHIGRYYSKKVYFPKGAVKTAGSADKIRWK
jgi:hypothetical protein